MQADNETSASSDYDLLSDEEFLRLSIETRADDDSEGLLDRARADSIAPHLTLDDVRWVTDFRNNPDTFHLPPEAAAAQFELTPEVIEALIACGNYVPEFGSHNKLILSLRGARLTEGGNSVEDAASIRITPVSPDHSNFRCLIGVYNKSNRKISLYGASTVPFKTGVLSYYNRFNFGSGTNCNLLPTGCYEHCVGTHFGSRTIPGVLRQGNGPNPDSASQVTVLRTRNDLVYGSKDFWHNTKPSDNIHPAFGTARFSSIGCQTVRGTQNADGTSTDEWGKFKRKAGFSADNQGTRFDNVITTAHEAGAIAAAQRDGRPLTDLVCLRHGSKGDLVKKIQAAVQLNPDGNFGPGTKEALANTQNQKLGFATGNCNREMAEMLGFSL